MPLDPIVSLTVALDEAPGSYAFWLGSGVSRDAGIPTGAEVFWTAVGELYRLEAETEETPDHDALTAWLAETERSDIGYSDILELITPDPATRRDYLGKFFEGREPGEAQERLADLAVRGSARAFVTTNFDRVLEHALQARGIEPVVISSDAILAAAPRREHSACTILKPHGDYLQETIRNTPAELAELEPGMAAELQEVLNRYGTIVIGYSGADQAISRAMRARTSRYGFYWVARRPELGEPARLIVETVSGRVIVRPGASDFLADFDRRLAVFAVQPSGLTPVTVNDEVLTLLRRGDAIGVRELLRGERREFDERITSLIERRRSFGPTAELAIEIHHELIPILERRLASLLPLDLDLFAVEVEWLAELKSSQPRRDGYTFYPGLVGLACRPVAGG